MTATHAAMLSMTGLMKARIGRRAASAARPVDAAPGRTTPQPAGTGVAGGRVTLVGAGPGDPELLTVKAVRALASAEAVVYDQLVGAAILELIPAGATRIYAGKQAGRHALPQAQINSLLIELAQEGLQVVRLKGGDPFIFGRGGEEMVALREVGIPVEVVPGITAAAGAGACTGIPLTHRSHARMLVFATGHLQNDALDLDWDCLSRPNQTVVIYMGLGALEIICTQLIEHGMPAPTPAAVIHAATTAAQSSLIGTLADLPARVRAAGMRTPALIMIGEVVSLARDPGPSHGALAATVAALAQG